MRWLPVLSSFWSSVAFRLTLNYSLLALGTCLVLLVLFYHQTMNIVEAQFTRQVETTAQRMDSYFEGGGREALLREITRELADRVNTDTEIFLLLDPDGVALAGNIAGEERLSSMPDERFETSVMLRGRLVHAYFVQQALPDDSRLLVGYDVRYLDEITNLVKRMLLAATLVMLLLVVMGAILFRRALQRRVEVIRQTAAHIGAGQLKQRVPVGREDEFARLERDINEMLDRIERLMDGARHVSDVVAHQLRTPLMRMLSRLRAMQREAQANPALAQEIDALSREVEELARISEKLLSIAEFESGIRRRRFEWVRLDTLVRDVGELYEAVAEEAGAVLVVCEGEPSVVQGDRDLIAGALINLVDNAVKYAGQGARITMEVVAQVDGTSLRVMDDGPGIPADRLARAGERFFRLAHGVPGHGLGLATVAAIARLHGAGFVLADAGPGLSVSLVFPRPAVAPHAST